MHVLKKILVWDRIWPCLLGLQLSDISPFHQLTSYMCSLVWGQDCTFQYILLFISLFSFPCYCGKTCSSLSSLWSSDQHPASQCSDAPFVIRPLPLSFHPHKFPDYCDLIFCLWGSQDRVVNTITNHLYTLITVTQVIYFFSTVPSSLQELSVNRSGMSYGFLCECLEPLFLGFAVSLSPVITTVDYGTMTKCRYRECQTSKDHLMSWSIQYSPAFHPPKLSYCEGKV